jgi:hypothetical protein
VARGGSSTIAIAFGGVGRQALRFLPAQIKATAQVSFAAHCTLFSVRDASVQLLQNPKQSITTPLPNGSFVIGQRRPITFSLSAERLYSGRSRSCLGDAATPDNGFVIDHIVVVRLAFQSIARSVRADTISQLFSLFGSNTRRYTL